jgi:hypothetical protein
MDATVTKKGPTSREIRTWMEAGEPRAALDVLVTPEIAKVLLTSNVPGETNRNMQKTYVAETAAAMKDGTWENTGEPIIVSDVGLLNDGQHRLQAIVESGVPATMDLRFGVKRHAFAATNSGRRRTGADALMIQGIGKGFALSATVRLAVCYSQGLPASARNRINNSQIVAAVERWPELITGLGHTALLRRPLRNAPVNVLAFFAVKTANSAVIEEFFDVLRDGTGHAANPPHQLREFLIRHHVAQGQDSATRTRALAVAILAWNAWCAGRELAKLDWRASQAFPVCNGLKL